jgi:hypothetical protein
VRNEEVLLRVSEQRNILRTIKRRKVNWNRHILHRDCLVKKNGIQRQIERGKQLNTRKKT